MTTIVSGFSPDGYLEYGAAFVETFVKHWPKDVKLIIYTEMPIRRIPEEVEQRSLWSIPGCREFIDGHPEPKYHGAESLPQWNKKDLRSEYSYRFDAVRFCRQLFIPDHAAESLPDGEILTWLDADVVTYTDVPTGLIERQIGDFDLVTMGRDGASSELGFWAVRLQSNTRLLLREIADSYRKRTVFHLNEWHSGYLFDHWVDQFKMKDMLKHKSLTAGHGHIWFKCEMGKYTDHLKGSTRKKLGYSPERFGYTVKQQRERGEV